MALYPAQYVADYTISYCTRAKKPISNLKLQKMLYFLWVDYYKKTKCELYLDDICAWKLGPVVPNVYYNFCLYAGISKWHREPICDTFFFDKRFGVQRIMLIEESTIYLTTCRQCVD